MSLSLGCLWGLHRWGKRGTQPTWATRPCEGKWITRHCFCITLHPNISGRWRPAPLQLSLCSLQYCSLDCLLHRKREEGSGISNLVSVLVTQSSRNCFHCTLLSKSVIRYNSWKENNDINKKMMNFFLLDGERVGLGWDQPLRMWLWTMHVPPCSLDVVKCLHSLCTWNFELKQVIISALMQRKACAAPLFHLHASFEMAA